MLSIQNRMSSSTYMLFAGWEVRTGRNCARGLGRDPFNQNFRKFRSKPQWIGSVQPEKFRKNESDRLELVLNGSRPLSTARGP